MLIFLIGFIIGAVGMYLMIDFELIEKFLETRTWVWIKWLFYPIVHYPMMIYLLTKHINPWKIGWFAKIQKLSKEDQFWLGVLAPHLKKYLDIDTEV